MGVVNFVKMIIYHPKVYAISQSIQSMDVDDDKSFAHTHTHRNMFDEGDVYGEIFFYFRSSN